MRIARCLPFVLLLVFCLSPGRAEEEATLDVDAVGPAERGTMVEHLRTAGRAPADYVLAKLAAHDLVMVGEEHQVRESCLFVAGLVERLHREAGVHLLLTEFVRSRNTRRLNELLTADAWDAEAIHDVMRDWAWPTWGFREYRAILRAAWEVNRVRAEGEPAFRVVGLDDEWDQYEYAWSDMSRKEKFDLRLKREAHLVAIAQREALDAGRKALVHIGFSHTLTGHGIRFGTVLTKNHGDRVFQVALHAKLPARGGPAPITGFLEGVWTEAGARPVGFDVVGSPLAPLRDDACVLWHYLASKRFEELAQGYVILAPLTELHKTSWIPGFVNEAQLERAKAVALRARLATEADGASAERLDAALRRRFPPPEETEAGAPEGGAGDPE